MTTQTTAPQITATELKFYNTFKNQAEAFGLLNTFEDRKDRNLFRSIQKRLNWTAPVKKTRITLTIEELTPIFNEYLASYDENGKVKVFDRTQAAEGLETHRKNPAATAMAVHGQLVWFDSCNDAIVKSFDRTGKNLRQLMAKYNEATGTNRFTV